MENLEKIAYWWVKISCYLALVMPFIFLPWTVYPYIFGKTVFFLTVLLSALPWYLFLIARRPEYRPKKSLIMYGLGVYFLAMVLATIFSFDPDRSFWSYPERMTGLWALFHYLLFFFMASSLFRTWNEWKKLLSFSVGVSVALSFIAFIQRYSPELVMQTGARTGAFMNNPIFLAAYLIFNIFFTLLILQKSERVSAKLMWGGFLAIQFVAFLFAETRGALIGMALGIFVYLVLFAILYKNKKVKKIILAVILILILSGIGFLFVKDQDWVGHIPGLNRFRSISISSGTGQTRLIAWEVAWKGFLEKPILGWGPENYFYTFNKYYNPESLRYTFYETWFDHAHNQILDQMNNTGVVGTLSYLAMFALIIISLIKLYRQKVIDLFVFSASISILIGYFIQNLFIFDQPNVLIMFYLCLAWWQSYEKGESKGKVWLKGKAGATTALIILGIVSLSYLYLFTFRPAFASTWVRQGVINSQAGDIQGTADAFEKGLTIGNQYPDMVPLYYAREIAQYGRAKQMPEESDAELFERADRVLRETIPMHPANIYNYYLLALINIEWGILDPVRLEQALADIDEGLKYSPDRQQLRFVKGKILLSMGRNDEAIAYYQETINLDPEVTESWWNLGIANYQSGYIDEAVVAFERSMEIGRHPANLAEVAAMIDVYVDQGNLEKVIEMYNLAIDNFAPENARLYAGIAAAYLEVGEYELARMHANIAKQLDPSLSADTNNFLQLVDFVEAGGTIEEFYGISEVE